MIINTTKTNQKMVVIFIFTKNDSWNESTKRCKIDDKEFVRIEAMICSMTKAERKNPKLLNGSRRVRIAKGSGTSVQEINKFMKSFEMTQK